MNEGGEEIRGAKEKQLRVLLLLFFNTFQYIANTKMSLPSSSNSRSSTVHSLSGKTQGLKFMQRAGIKKKDDFDNKSNSSNPSTPNKFNNSLQQDSIADSSFQSNASSSSAVNDSFEQWSIPNKKPLTLNQNSTSTRFQPELAWNSWHLHSQKDEDDDDVDQDEKNQTTEKDDDFNFISDDYRPASGERRKRYGEWAVQKRKRQKRSEGDQDDQDDNESDLDESREPLLEDSEEEERSRSKPKKVKKEVS